MRVRIWQRVEQLLEYGSAIRKVMYAMNAIESTNSSMRKMIKKGVYPNEASVIKVLYLRIRDKIENGMDEQ